MLEFGTGEVKIQVNYNIDQRTQHLTPGGEYNDMIMLKATGTAPQHPSYYRFLFHIFYQHNHLVAAATYTQRIGVKS